jgi:hypothetical protein
MESHDLAVTRLASFNHGGLSATPTPTDVSFTDPRPRRVGSAQREVTAARKRTTSRRLRSRTTGNGASSVT